MTGFCFCATLDCPCRSCSRVLDCAEICYFRRWKCGCWRSSICEMGHARHCSHVYLPSNVMFRLCITWPDGNCTKSAILFEFLQFLSIYRIAVLLIFGSYCMSEHSWYAFGNGGIGFLFGNLLSFYFLGVEWSRVSSLYRFFPVLSPCTSCWWTGNSLPIKFSHEMLYSISST